VGDGGPDLTATAVVTGAAGGLGRALVGALASSGLRVVACDIRPAVTELAYDGVDAIVADVADADDVQRVADRAGDVDVLVNNAAVVRRTHPLDSWEQTVEDFAATIGPNLRGAYLMGRAVIPRMVARGRGDIVNVAADHQHTCGWPVALDHDDAPDCPWRDAPRYPCGGRSFDLYDASKWALNGLTFTWALALRPHGVRVNNLCLGATDTPMLRSFLGEAPDPDVLASSLRPADVAAVVLELLAEGPDGRTGDNIGLWVGHPCVLPAPGSTALRS